MQSFTYQPNHHIPKSENSYLHNFQDKDGKDVVRTLAYVKDVAEFVKTIMTGRNINNERLLISADSGCGKLLVTCSIYDADKDGKILGYQPGSDRRIFLLAMVDDVCETTSNIGLILEKLGFPLPNPDVEFVSDIKLLLLVLGLHGSSAMHSCPYCHGFRARWEVDPKTGVGKWVKIGSGGRWIPGELRTSRTIQEHYEKWMAETGGKANLLK